MIAGYDQWKTASPYDDDIDLEVPCPKCDSDMVEVVDYDKWNETYSLECEECGNEFKHLAFN